MNSSHAALADLTLEEGQLLAALLKIPFSYAGGNDLLVSFNYDTCKAIQIILFSRGILPIVHGNLNQILQWLIVYNYDPMDLEYNRHYNAVELTQRRKYT
jgi:hypothetical protein